MNESFCTMVSKLSRFSTSFRFVFSHGVQKKNRTHVVETATEKDNVPRSFVFRRGNVSNCSRHLFGRGLVAQTRRSIVRCQRFMSMHFVCGIAQVDDQNVVPLACRIFIFVSRPRPWTALLIIEWYLCFPCVRGTRPSVRKGKAWQNMR